MPYYLQKPLPYYELMKTGRSIVHSRSNEHASDTEELKPLSSNNVGRKKSIDVGDC